LRREGRRKRKAGAKNEKATLIISLSSVRSRKIQGKFPKILCDNHLLSL
jgi:hypothetical protein